MRYLTVVYRLPDDFNADSLITHEHMSACSWSHALHDRDSAIKEIEFYKKEQKHDVDMFKAFVKT